MSYDLHTEADKEICTELREKRDNGVRYETLDEEYDLSIIKIIQHVIGDCECTHDEIDHIPYDKDEAWREKYVAKKLYIDIDLKFKEMEDVLNCHAETARKYVVQKFNICSLDSKNRTSSTTVNKIQRIGLEEDDVEIK